MNEIFSINQKVIHCREGLCKIESETLINGNEYFVVKSVAGNGENIYVLKNRTENIIRPIMDINEAKKLIEYINSVEAEFMSNTKQRRDFYKRKLSSGSVYDLAFLAKQLFLFHYLNSQGTLIKLGPTDIEMLECAEKILFDEFAIVFNKEILELHSFLLNKYNCQI